MRTTLRNMMGSVMIMAAVVAVAPRAQATISMLHDFQYSHPTFVHPNPFATTHILLQISQAIPARWNLALNNAQNIMDYLGQQHVQIVVVAFGPGLKMYFKGSPVATRIQSLNAEGVEFDACDNTYKQMTKVMGRKPQLVKAAVLVPAGIIRIVQLERDGFSYVKP
ncbi:MAG: DsrE family protein [Acidiferrobacter sp.]